MSRGVSVFAIAVAAMAACVTGNVQQEEIGNELTDAGRDALFPLDDSGLPDVKPGTLFDVVDDAPCTPGSKAACKTTCGTLGSAACVAGDYGPCKALPGDPCTGLDCTGKGDGLEHTYHRDGDGDGHGDPKATIQACDPPAGYLTSKDDCDDGVPTCTPARRRSATASTTTATGAWTRACTSRSSMYRSPPYRPA